MNLESMGFGCVLLSPRSRVILVASSCHMLHFIFPLRLQEKRIEEKAPGRDPHVHFAGDGSTGASHTVAPQLAEVHEHRGDTQRGHQLPGCQGGPSPRTTPMEVESMAKGYDEGQGKGKGKGKGKDGKAKGKGKGTEKQDSAVKFECYRTNLNCGQWTHRWTDCWKGGGGAHGKSKDRGKSRNKVKHGKDKGKGKRHPSTDICGAEVASR